MENNEMSINYAGMTNKNSFPGEPSVVRPDSAVRKEFDVVFSKLFDLSEKIGWLNTRLDDVLTPYEASSKEDGRNNTGVVGVSYISSKLIEIVNQLEANSNRIDKIVERLEV